MPTNITMLNGDVVTLGFSEDNEALEREALKVIEKYCGREFVNWYKGATIPNWERDPPPDDARSYEAQNEEYANAFRDISDLIYQYETKVFDGKSRISRKDLESFITGISGIVNEMI